MLTAEKCDNREPSIYLWKLKTGVQMFQWEWKFTMCTVPRGSVNGLRALRTNGQTALRACYGRGRRVQGQCASHAALSFPRNDAPCPQTVTTFPNLFCSILWFDRVECKMKQPEKSISYSFIVFPVTYIFSSESISRLSIFIPKERKRDRERKKYIKQQGRKERMEVINKERKAATLQFVPKQNL